MSKTYPPVPAVNRGTTMTDNKGVRYHYDIGDRDTPPSRWYPDNGKMFFETNMGLMTRDDFYDRANGVL